MKSHQQSTIIASSKKSISTCITSIAGSGKNRIAGRRRRGVIGGTGGGTSVGIAEGVSGGIGAGKGAGISAGIGSGIGARIGVGKGVGIGGEPGVVGKGGSSLGGSSLVGGQKRWRVVGTGCSFKGGNV